MMKNVCGIEKVLRIVIGLILIALVFVGPKTPWGGIGAILVVTGLIGWCPISKLVGINTCPARQKDQPSGG